jgi:hypothetical protein
MRTTTGRCKANRKQMTWRQTMIAAAASVLLAAIATAFIRLLTDLIVF